MGACAIFATSDGYGDDLANLGAVVNPIWLLTIMCIVPPILCPGKPDIAKHSATIPWPAKAASPCIKTGITFFLLLSLWKNCLARTWPRTTGFTASKCEGLSVRLIWTELPSNTLFEEAPKWYLTSPSKLLLVLTVFPKNSLKIALNGLPITFAKTFSLPLWGMPIFISFAPKFPPFLIICSNAGINDSPPSNPNLLVPTNFTCRYFSKPSAWIILFKIAFFPFSVNEIFFSGPSILSLIQLFSSGSPICINS